MHHEKIASTFLKKCEEDKKWKEKNKSILLYQGENMSTFLKKCGKKKVEFLQIKCGNLDMIFKGIFDFFEGNIHLLHCLYDNFFIKME